MRVFVAGATGVVGQRLIPQLIAAGHQVTGTTRNPTNFDGIRRLGAQPVTLDGLDAVAVGNAVAQAEPDVIMHQMTGLAGGFDMRHFDRTFAVTNQLRVAGTDNLLAAAQAAGVPRYITQSFTGWPNERVGGPVKTEDDPLDTDPPTDQRETLAALQHLERAVLQAPLDGVVLRYGLLYGPGAWADMMEIVRKRQLPIVGHGGAIWSMLHLDDAASAAVAALERGHGVYNVVDDDPAPVEQIVTVLADSLEAKAPRHVPVWLARLMAGDVGVSMMTKVRGSSNAKAKRELGWTPTWSTWRDGLRQAAGDTAAAS